MNRKVLEYRVKSIMKYDVVYRIEYLYHQSGAAKHMSIGSLERRMRDFKWAKRGRKGSALIYVKELEQEPKFSPLYRRVINKLNGLRKGLC